MTLSLFLSIVLGCLSIGTIVQAWGSCPDNTVNLNEFLNDIATGPGELFLNVYTLEKNTENTYGKTKSAYTRVGDRINSIAVSYNEDKNECEIFPDENQSIRIKYGKTMRCGKKRKDSWIVLVSEGALSETRFVSQDTSKYFLAFDCLDGAVDSLEACNEGILDLYIPDIRANQTGEIDLNGLPWDQISEDVENFTGQTIDTLKYTQIGPEC